MATASGEIKYSYVSYAKNRHLRRRSRHGHLVIAPPAGWLHAELG